MKSATHVSARSEYPLSDALGSVYATTDGTGTVAHRYDYDVWGVRSDLGGSGPGVDFGYTGQRHDSNGLMGIGDRPYLPRVGRWLQPDRAGMVDGPSLYQYVRSSPAMFLDPTGEIRFGDYPGPLSGWIPLPQEDDSTMRVEVDWASELAITAVQRLKVLARVNQLCALQNFRFNEASAEDLRNSIVWRRVAIKGEQYPPRGEAAPPLGQHPYRIAVSSGYLATEHELVGGVDRAGGLLALARTIVHEFMHQVLQYPHPANFNPDNPDDVAKDPPSIIAKEAIP